MEEDLGSDQQKDTIASIVEGVKEVDSLFEKVLTLCSMKCSNPLPRTKMKDLCEEVRAELNLLKWQVSKQEIS